MLDICEGFFGHSCLNRMLSDREMLLGLGMGALIGGVSGSVACIFMHRDLEPFKAGIKETGIKLDELARKLDRKLVRHDEKP